MNGGVAVVLGVGPGIGGAVARKWASQGFKVWCGIAERKTKRNHRHAVTDTRPAIILSHSASVERRSSLVDVTGHGMK